MPDHWMRPAPGDRGGPAAWDGAPAGEDVRLEVWLGPTGPDGAQPFRCFLASELGRPLEAVAEGRAHAGPTPVACWVDLAHWQHVLSLEDGRNLGVPAGIEAAILRTFAESLPPGGHLFAEYDSPGRDMTARALAARVPPIATPLGWVMHVAGCGDAYRDRGYLDGGRRLQGFRAPDEAHARTRGLEMLADLHEWMRGSADLDWDIQAQTRPLAQAAIDELTARYE